MELISVGNAVVVSEATLISVPTGSCVVLIGSEVVDVKLDRSDSVTVLVIHSDVTVTVLV